ncbi:MAG: tRNA lysidine(34) synthetase TilS [Dermatophilaceae bacterium]
MSGPHPATAAIRGAVRAALIRRGPDDVTHVACRGGPDDVTHVACSGGPDSLVLVACSGGPDSLALAAALAFEAPRLGIRAGAVVVDHGLQSGSARVAAEVAHRLAAGGLDPVDVVAVTVPHTSDGPESAAREARYAALDLAADRHGAALVLLGHTRDDQAEQVLLGLVRGSGARSLAGMPRARGRYRRPLLDISRDQTRASCTAEGLSPWDDPMNADPAYTRVRARRALADLERDLGPGVTGALARTADLLRADADLLDSFAADAVARLGVGPWPVADLAGLPTALRTRVWRRLLTAAGAPAGAVGIRQVQACDRLLTLWHGQGPVHAPGGLRVTRADGRVTIA